MTVRVEYPGGEPNGLAAMIGGLIEANLAQHPERETLLKPATVAIVAHDAHVALTLEIEPGRVLVWNGLHGKPEVMVRSDAETLTDLTSVPLRLGLPNAMTKPGREVTRKLVRGQLRVAGLVRHPGVVSRLNRLLSVA